MSKTKTAKRLKKDPLAFEEARDAVAKLKAIKPLLSPEEEETLAILIDKKLVRDLRKSLAEMSRGEYESLESAI